MFWHSRLIITVNNGVTSSFQKGWETTWLGATRLYVRGRHRRADVGSGWSIKDVFSSNWRTPFCCNFTRQGSVTVVCGRTLETSWNSQLYSTNKLANQVSIRKEAKSYRMSDIQNLRTFGKDFIKPSRQTKQRRASVSEANISIRTYFDVQFAQQYS